MTKQYGTRVDAPIVAGNDDTDDIAAALNRQIQGAFQVFADNASRDAWATNFESRREETTAIVLSDENGDVSWARWDKADGKFAEFIPMANNDLKQAIADVDQQVADLKQNGADGYINVHLDHPDEQYGNAQTNEIAVLPPLNVWNDPDKTHGLKLELKPGTFEPLHAPSFLAYLSEDAEIIGRLAQGEELTEGAHHKGALWFDDIVVPEGAYIELRRDDKSYGIQEADELDPNVTGGMDYLICARIAMKGAAPSDGFVRMYLYSKSVDPFEPTGYLTDKSGNPIVVQRQYKTDDELGYLDLNAIVNAKGLQEFTVNVVNTFQGDILEIEDRTEGASGLMIQALKSDYKTGMGLIQYERDTAQQIVFSSHYNGEIFSLNFANSRPDPIQDYTAGTNFTVSDGLELINRSGLKVGVVDGRTVIQDDGSHMTDFNYGKIFSQERTEMLIGKQIKVDTTTTTKQSDARVRLAKWVGTGEATQDIIQSWNNGVPVAASGWQMVDDFEIVENALTEDNDTTHTFTVPVDAKQFAIVLTPNSPVQPYKVEIKKLDVNVVEPFTGYIVKPSHSTNEEHLAFSDEYKEFVADDRGFASARYTVSTGTHPMPVGYPGKGSADITIDRSLNNVPGTQVPGDEGVLVFGADGDVTILTDLYVWSEKPHGEVHKCKFWWATYDPDTQTFTKIDESELDVGVRGQTKAYNRMPTFKLQVEKGQKIGLFASGDVDDAAYIQANTAKDHLVLTKITFKELVIQAYDDPLSGVDLSQFTAVKYSASFPEIDFFNKSSMVIPFDVPDDVNIVVMSAVKEMPDLSVRKVASLDWNYSNTDKTLSVSFGENVAIGRLTIGVFL